jgi:hypothetical protein
MKECLHLFDFFCQGKQGLHAGRKDVPQVLLGPGVGLVGLEAAGVGALEQAKAGVAAPYVGVQSALACGGKGAVRLLALEWVVGAVDGVDLALQDLHVVEVLLAPCHHAEERPAVRVLGLQVLGWRLRSGSSQCWTTNDSKLRQPHNKREFKVARKDWKELTLNM